MLLSAAVAGAQVFITYPELDSADTDTDSLYFQVDSLISANGMDTMEVRRVPVFFYSPQVYVPYELLDSVKVEPESRGEFTQVNGSAMQWLENERRMNQMVRLVRQNHAMSHPGDVHYNLKDLPKAPEAVVITMDNPAEVTVVTGNIASDVNAQVEQVQIAKQHWKNKLGINLQFSQAYISPNWYQGGTSSLNLIADFTYTSNLNTQLHPKLLFENFFQWRTALTSAPDDQYRSYNITENRLQINTKFGYKASSKWYYTLTGLFKTPVFNSYKSNTQTLTASFLSPGELNFGLGMTFNTKNKSGSLSFNATIAPLSYNLKTVLSDKMTPESQGLKPGHKTLSSFGSNVDAVLNWKMCYNVNWRSRVFFFTNYEYSQMDWQNQFQFTINRFLTANLNVDLRYDTSIKATNRDKTWGLLQLRELISLGFTYNINH